jgi:hypothetical protein
LPPQLEEAIEMVRLGGRFNSDRKALTEDRRSDKPGEVTAEPMSGFIVQSPVSAVSNVKTGRAAGTLAAS